MILNFRNSIRILSDLQSKGCNKSMVIHAFRFKQIDICQLLSFLGYLTKKNLSECFLLSKNIQFCSLNRKQTMGYLRSTKSLLRKAILIGWAVAVVWIYLGNLVNFHQHHIWGKQLIPVAYSSTRYKDENSGSVVKNDNSSKSFDTSLHFDFATLAHQITHIPYFEIVSSPLLLSDTPFLHTGIQAFSFRGPPSA